MRESTSKHARLGLIGAAIALAAALALPAAASAATPFPGANPWVNLHFLNIAHQGGEDEVPSATMYALKSAITEGGADMLEIDVQLTADNQLVVLHDDVYNTKSCLPALCASPATEPTRDESQIRDLTLQELRALDAAYWFRPNTYAARLRPARLRLPVPRRADRRQGARRPGTRRATSASRRSQR